MKKIFLISLLLLCFCGCNTDEVTPVPTNTTLSDAPLSDAPPQPPTPIPPPIPEPIPTPIIQKSDKPALYFSDLVFAPVGSMVTVWGNNLSKVRVVGATEYFYQTDTEICFRIGNVSEIAIADDQTGIISRLPFTIGQGKIYYIDDVATNGDGSIEKPFNSPTEAWKKAVSGDVCYIRQSEWRNKQYGYAASRKAIMCLSNGKEGVAWIAYPNEEVMINATDAGFATCFYGVPKGTVISKIKCLGAYAVLYFGDNFRFIGNDCSSGSFGGYGNFHGGAGHLRYLGNYLHDCTGGSTLYHPIYLALFDIPDFEIAWNRIENNYQSAYLVKIEQDSTPNHEHRHYWNGSFHDNFVYNRLPNKERGFLFGPAENSANGETFIDVYRNIFVNIGLNDSWGVFRAVNNGISGSREPYRVKFHHNTVVQFEGSKPSFAVSIGGAGLGTGDINHNIFYGNYTGSFISGDGMKEVDSNCYFGSGKKPAEDANAVVADPLFINPAALDFRLQDNSPAKGMGAL